MSTLFSTIREEKNTDLIRTLSGTVRVRQAMGEMEKIQNFEFALLGEGLPPGHHFKPKTFCQNHFVCQKIRKNAFGNCTIMCHGKKNTFGHYSKNLGLRPMVLGHNTKWVRGIIWRFYNFSCC